jgi:hypothetical protein
MKKMTSLLACLGLVAGVGLLTACQTNEAPEVEEMETTTMGVDTYGTEDPMATDPMATDTTMDPMATDTTMDPMADDTTTDMDDMDEGVDEIPEQ